MVSNNIILSFTERLNSIQTPTGFLIVSAFAQYLSSYINPIIMTQRAQNPDLRLMGTDYLNTSLEEYSAEVSKQSNNEQALLDAHLAFILAILQDPIHLSLISDPVFQVQDTKHPKTNNIYRFHERSSLERLALIEKEDYQLCPSLKLQLEAFYSSLDIYIKNANETQKEASDVKIVQWSNDHRLTDVSNTTNAGTGVALSASPPAASPIRRTDTYATDGMYLGFFIAAVAGIPAALLSENDDVANYIGPILIGGAVLGFVLGYKYQAISNMLGSVRFSLCPRTANSTMAQPLLGHS
jgi:hypothetical protein